VDEEGGEGGGEEGWVEGVGFSGDAMYFVGGVDGEEVEGEGRGGGRSEGGGGGGRGEGGEEGVEVGGGFAGVGVVKKREERRMRRGDVTFPCSLPPSPLLLKGSL